MGKVIIKPWVKFFGVVVLAMGIVFGLYTIGKKTNIIKNDNSNGGLFSFGKSNKSEDYITVGTNTYAGFLPFMYLNGGLEPTENSRIYKEYGIKLKIVIQDDFDAGRKAFLNDNINIIYCTADAFPVEMSENSSMSQANVKFINISNWSRGADAIVVNKNITNVGDLIGKVVACSEGTASHTLLLNTLETNGIGYDKVNLGNGIDQNKVNIKVVASGLDAASIFKAGQCDAAVVFSPDDQDIVSTIKGAKVLISTKQASNIICDGLLSKASYIDANKDKIKKLLTALLNANVEMNTNPSAVDEAAKAFAKSYGTDETFAIAGSKNIHYVTLGDALNFFGFENSYTGIKADEMYSKMSRVYEGLKLCNSPLPWRKVSDTSIIETIADSKEGLKGDQNAEGKITFSAPTKQMDNVSSISNKKLTILFEVNSDILNNDAKAVIDREFVTIAKQFSNMRIRIEGNTDDTGLAVYNIDLSKRRAKAVVNYLVKEYNFDINRFIVVGNGPKHAILDGVRGDNQKYRTTDFQLIED